MARALAVIAIVLVGAALRVTGIGFGDPFVYHPDEWIIAGPAMTMAATGDWNPHNFFVSLTADRSRGGRRLGHACAGRCDARHRTAVAVRERARGGPVRVRAGGASDRRRPRHGDDPGRVRDDAPARRGGRSTGRGGDHGRRAARGRALALPDHRRADDVHVRRVPVWRPSSRARTAGGAGGCSQPFSPGWQDRRMEWARRCARPVPGLRRDPVRRDASARDHPRSARRTRWSRRRSWGSSPRRRRSCWHRPRCCHSSRSQRISTRSRTRGRPRTPSRSTSAHWSGPSARCWSGVRPDWSCWSPGSVAIPRAAAP